MSHAILVVDDDADIRKVVCFALRKEGFETLEAQNGEEAIDLWQSRDPSLVVLDILMPEMDGFEVCRHMRSGVRASLGASTPIIFLSSRDSEIDRVVGLELGGDDYVTKPFSPRELVARVKAVLRRQGRTSSSGGQPAKAGVNRSRQQVLRHGPLVLDTVSHKVRWDEQEVPLTVTEFAVLRTLMSHPCKVFTRSELVDRAHTEQVMVSARTMDSHVTRIRRKFKHLKVDPIETVHGVGYTCSPVSKPNSI